MSYIDLILLVLILIGAYGGFKKGLIIELASLIALILGIYAAFSFSSYAAEILENTFDMNGKYVNIVAFIITFLIVVFLVHLLGKALEKVINLVALGFLNKAAGGLFGALKMVVYISIFFMILSHFNIQLISTEKQENSFLWDPIEDVAPYLWDEIQEYDPTIKEKAEEQLDKV